MMKPWKIVAALEADNSRLSKEKIVTSAAVAGNDEFFEGFRLAYDPMITFGVKKVEERFGKDGSLSDAVAQKKFMVLATKLQKRELTGHDARDAIEGLMDECTNEQWNGWFRRILIKDMRCGTSDSTVNKIAKKLKMKKYEIPLFECQLAHDSQNHEQKVTGRKMIEVKLDGVRVLTVVYPDGRVDQYSRNGKELVNFDHIKQQISLCAGQFKEPMVLDGEVMSKSFQDLMTQVHRKSNVKAGDAILYLFDMIPLKDFQKGKYNVSQEDRTNALKDWYNNIFNTLIMAGNVNILDHEIVDLDTKEGNKRFREINKTAIAGGYEGIMIKDLKAPYECKRSVAWLKLKPFIEVSLKVTAIEEGTGKFECTMGAILCEGVDDGKEIKVSVGSGFSDSLRDEIWANKKKVLNDIAEIRADAITQNRDGTYSLRFPRFKTFRGFKHGEKI